MNALAEMESKKHDGVTIKARPLRLATASCSWLNEVLPPAHAPRPEVRRTFPLTSVVEHQQIAAKLGRAQDEAGRGADPWDGRTFMTRSVHLKNDATVDDLVAVIERDGGAIIDRFLSPAEVDDFRRDIDPYLDSYSPSK